MEATSHNDTLLSTSSYAGRKYRILLMLLAYAGLIGIVSIVLPVDSRGLNFIFGLPGLILSATWCYIDANQHGYTIGRFMRLGLLFLFAIAFPIYIFQTRGLAGIKTLALAVLFAATMAVCALITAIVTLSIGTSSAFVE
jgi:hypothetical protein